MRVLVFSLFLLLINNVEAAVGNQTLSTRILEPILTVEFVQRQERQCNSPNRKNRPEKNPSIENPSVENEVLLGILLAARESGIEVKTIEENLCFDKLNPT